MSLPLSEILPDALSKARAATASTGLRCTNFSGSGAGGFVARRILGKKAKL